MSNDKSEASDIEMEDLCSNSNMKGQSNAFNANHINEMIFSLPKSEDDILKNEIEIEKNNIPKKEEIDILFGELAEIEIV